MSTADQRQDLQHDGLSAFAARADLEIIETYRDVALAARREGRAQLNALITAARNHEIDCALLWKFDRFARSNRHLLPALEEFDHLGKRIGRPPLAPRVVGRIEILAATATLGVPQLQNEIAERAGRGVVGENTKRVRGSQTNAS